MQSHGFVDQDHLLLYLGHHLGDLHQFLVVLKVDVVFGTPVVQQHEVGHDER